MDDLEKTKEQAPYVLSATELSFYDHKDNPEQAISFEGWIALGDHIAHLRDASNWWIGDWLLYGEAKWGEKYTQAMNLFGLSYGTLVNIVQVCRKIPASMRYSDVPFTQHAVLAVYARDNPDAYKKMMNTVARHSLTVTETRELVKTEEMISFTQSHSTHEIQPELTSGDIEQSEQGVLYEWEQGENWERVRFEDIRIAVMQDTNGNNELARRFYTALRSASIESVRDALRKLHPKVTVSKYSVGDYILDTSKSTRFTLTTPLRFENKQSGRLKQNFDGVAFTVSPYFHFMNISSGGLDFIQKNVDVHKIAPHDIANPPHYFLFVKVFIATQNLGEGKYRYIPISKSSYLQPETGEIVDILYGSKEDKEKALDKVFSYGMADPEWKWILKELGASSYIMWRLIPAHVLFTPTTTAEKAIKFTEAKPLGKGFSLIFEFTDDREALDKVLLARSLYFDEEPDMVPDEKLFSYPPYRVSNDLRPNLQREGIVFHHDEPGMHAQKRDDLIDTEGRIADTRRRNL